MKFILFCLSRSHSPQYCFHRANWAKHSPSGSPFIILPHSFAKSQRAASSRVNGMLFFRAPGSGSQCKIGPLEFWTGGAAGGSRLFLSSLLLRFSEGPFLLSENAAIFWCVSSLLAFGHCNALRHAFDGNSFAGHFDMDEKRCGGQTGAICLQ